MSQGIASDEQLLQGISEAQEAVEGMEGQLMESAAQIGALKEELSKAEGLWQQLEGVTLERDNAQRELEEMEEIASDLQQQLTDLQQSITASEALSALAVNALTSDELETDQQEDRMGASVVGDLYEAIATMKDRISGLEQDLKLREETSRGDRAKHFQVA